MKARYGFALAVMALALAACGNGADAPTEAPQAGAAETEAVEVETQQSEAETPDGATGALINPDGKDIGEGTVYLINSSGDTQDGSAIRVDKGATLDQIGLDARGVSGKNKSQIYVDGELLTEETLADTQTSIDLEGKHLDEGEHIVEVVQYDDANTIVFYRMMKYNVE